MLETARPSLCIVYVFFTLHGNPFWRFPSSHILFLLFPCWFLVIHLSRSSAFLLSFLLSSFSSYLFLELCSEATKVPSHLFSLFIHHTLVKEPKYLCHVKVLTLYFLFSLSFSLFSFPLRQLNLRRNSYSWDTLCVHISFLDWIEFTGSNLSWNTRSNIFHSFPFSLSLSPTSFFHRCTSYKKEKKPKGHFLKEPYLARYQERERENEKWKRRGWRNWVLPL